MKDLLFVPAHVVTGHARDADSNEYIKDEDGEAETTAVGKTALFEEYEWETGTGDGVGAAPQPKEGWQATVREKSRGKDIKQDKTGESDQESF
ncbi:MAG: hypothetical protein H6635_08695 [Anaerolineales bacterium]|nr:hypothetical protein [Anaerolineales bacterium]MCB9145434.1 hypothetical protein [Anaerolineales bacterium]